MERRKGVRRSGGAGGALTARPYALAAFAAGAASLVVLWNPVAALEVTAGGAGLLVALRRGSGLTATAASWALYLPVAFALGEAVPPVWNYLAAALFVIVLSEMMSFELEFSAAVYSSQGVDEEAAGLARAAGAAHAKELVMYLALVAPVVALSAALSGVTQYASDLFAGAILLFLVLVVYARR